MRFLRCVFILLHLLITGFAVPGQACPTAVRESRRPKIRVCATRSCCRRLQRKLCQNQSLNFLNIANRVLQLFILHPSKNLLEERTGSISESDKIISRKQPRGTNLFRAQLF